MAHLPTAAEECLYWEAERSSMLLVKFSADSELPLGQFRIAHAPGDDAGAA